MKVLHIFNSLMPSGAETMTVNAKQIFRDEGVETDVIATSVDIGVYAETMEAAAFGVYHLPHTRRSLIDVSYSIRMFSFIRKRRYEAVQIHPESWRFTNVLIAKLAGVRQVVTTVHSHFELKGWRFWRRCMSMRLMASMGVKIVAIGDSVYENELRYSPYPIKIYNWIDSSRFQRSGESRLRHGYREEFMIPLCAKVVVIVGNCSKIKNHDFFFRVFSRLPLNCYALHVGQENDVTAYERKIASELHIADRIRFLGGRNDLDRLLECADVFVMCSEKEGLGIACIEALAMGVPSVVSDVSGLRDLVNVIPLCEKAELDEKRFVEMILRQLTLSMERLGELRIQTSRVIQQNFSATCNARKYIALWRGER